MPSTLRWTILTVAALTLMGVTGPAAAESTPDDGVKLAFVSGDWDDMVLYVADAAGTTLKPIGKGQVGEFLAAGKAWSPDGRRIAYVSSASGSPRLYVVNADGTGDTVIADGPFDLALGLHWSPDGTRIAFVSDRGGNDDLYVVDVATGQVTNLSHDSGPTSHPYWSPDGTRLSYITRDEAIPQDDVYIVAATGSVPVNVTADVADHGDGSWSPDGSHFLFLSERDGNTEIYVVEADGSNQVNLTRDPSEDTSAAWSPDGSMIAFTSGEPQRIYVMNSDGTGSKRITDGSIDHVVAPEMADHYDVSQTPAAWSPDGSLLAIVAGLNGMGPHQRAFDIFVVDIAGNDAPVLMAEGGGGASVRWSADGTRMIVSETGNYGIDGAVSLVSAEGGPITRLIMGTNASASWSPDGTHLMYSAGGASPAKSLFIANADGTDSIDITSDLPGPYTFAAAWQPQRKGPVSLVDPATGRWYVTDEWGWQRSFYFGNPGDVPLLGDWDCDGEETPGLYRQTDGYVYLRNSTTQGIADVKFFFGNPGDTPLAGDFNADGCDTVSLYRPSEGRIYVINRLGSQDLGLGAAEIDYVFGNPGDKPFVGDFNGDGIDTVGLHRESTGFMYLRQTHTTGVADAEFYFGDPGDLVIAGDWTGDGIDTVGVFRPSEHRFYLNHHNGAGAADQAFWMGRPGWIPLAGGVTPGG